jgi:RsiW-degrading membrane proteinase PrsW (M82 family)
VLVPTTDRASSSTFARRHGSTAAAALYGAAATRRSRDLVRFLGAFVLAVVLHTLWDGQGSLVDTAVVAVASLGLLGLTAHRAGRADARRPVPHPGTA